MVLIGHWCAMSCQPQTLEGEEGGVCGGGGGGSRAMSNGYRARMYARDTGIWP